MKILTRIKICVSLLLLTLASILPVACVPDRTLPPAQPTLPAHTPDSQASPIQPAQTVPQPKAEVFKWRLQSHVPAGIENDLLGQMAELVLEMSGGRLTFEVFAEGQLVSIEDQLAATQTGMIQMSRAAGDYYTSFLPEGNIEAGIPLTWRDLHDVTTLFWDRGLIELLREAYEENNVYLLGIGASAPFCFWARQDIGGVEGLNGLKIRSFGLYMEVLRDLGAAAVYIPHAETSLAAQTGVIDAVFTVAYVFQDLRYYDTFRHYYANKWGVHTNNLIVNMNAWNSLGGDLQAILEAAGKIDAYNQDRVSRQVVNHMEGRMTRDWDVTMHSLSDADMRTISGAALPYLDDYAARSPRMARMISIIKDYMAEAGYLP